MFGIRAPTVQDTKMYVIQVPSFHMPTVCNHCIDTIFIFLQHPFHHHQRKDASPLVLQVQHIEFHFLHFIQELIYYRKHPITDFLEIILPQSSAQKFDNFFCLLF